MDVLTPTGFKDIKRLRKGSEVIAFDNNGERIINTVEEICIWNKKTYDEGSQGEFLFYIINGNLKLYKNQSIYANGRVVHAKDLKIGDRFFDHNRSEVKVYSITSQKGNLWHKLRISGNHCYIVKGAYLHNAARFFVLQNASHNLNATAPTNWGSSSGTADSATSPTGTDDATFDGAGAGNNTATVAANLGCLSLTFTAGYTSTITQNTATTITIGGNFTDNTAHTWTVNGTGAMTITAASTITSGGKTYPGSVTFSGSNTKALAADWAIGGTLTALTATTTINSNTLSCNGFTASATTAGSTTIKLTGGTWSGANNVSTNLTFAGNVTVSGSVTYLTNTLLYSSGTITTTSSTLSLGGSCTLNTNGISWNNVTITAASTITNNSLLTVGGTLTINDGIAVTFAGTAGFTSATFTISSISARTITFVNNVTYTVQNTFNAFASRTGSILLLTSDHATNRANLTIASTATKSVKADFTRMDCSGGQTVGSFHGTMTDSPNTFSYTDANVLAAQNQVMVRGSNTY